MRRPRRWNRALRVAADEQRPARGRARTNGASEPPTILLTAYREAMTDRRLWPDRSQIARERLLEVFPA